MARKLLMSRRQYAAHRGCTLHAVQKALAAGRICLAAGTSLIDPEAADVAWLQNTDPSKVRPRPSRR